MDTATENRIFEELSEIRKAMTSMTRNGCANGWQHKDHADRILKLEDRQAEMRGKAAVAGGAVAIVASAFFTWIGKKL